MGAAGWHSRSTFWSGCSTETPIGRIAGAAAMQFDGWQRLNAAYAQQFGVEVPKWGAS